VICGPANHAKPDCIDNPMVLAEVTSPSTKDYDYGTKREYYFGLPSVQHYLLVSQTDRTVGHCQRAVASWIYADYPPHATIYLGSVEILVSYIYAGFVP